MDAKTSTVSTPTDLDVPAQGAGAPFERVAFRTTSATVGMWVNVQGGEAGANGPGSVFFAPREACDLPYVAPRAGGKWRVCSETGAAVQVNAVVYTADDLARQNEE